MNAWKVIFATLVIFGAGIVTGALAVKHSQRVHWRETLAQSVSASKQVQPPETASRSTNRVFTPPGPLMGLRKDFIKNMERDLELTEAQRERIEKILGDGQEETRQLWDPVAPKMKEVWIKVKENIRAELTEEQTKKYEEFMKRGRKPDDRKSPAPGNPPLKDPPAAVPAKP